ncbi:MAG: serine/threonine protein phosphatase [Treponema sp.]|jgi:predicted phosphodiesterase|nr:serine/threonine protein phosphatase [Treponema sp.]
MAEITFFDDITSHHFNPDAILDISGNGRALVISDFHMGTGRGDDLANNGEMLISLLEDYYLRGGWYLVLNGDIEELQRYSLDSIRERWFRLYRIFDHFASRNRLYKIVGNHDEELLLKKSYPYPLYSAVKIETGVIPAFVYHGHQASRFYLKYNKLAGVGLRYFLKPFGIRNISSARSPNRRFSVEKKAYAFSLENHCLSIIGHTHRPLFESLGRFDYIKFEIERLCRDYPASEGRDRQQIEREVAALIFDLGKLGRSERRNVLRQSLYGDDLPVPCLFNSGSAIGKKGINAIELSNEQIALVYWFAEGKGKRFISRGGYQVEKLAATPYRRAVLNQDRLDYVKARIDLLGAQQTQPVQGC